MTLIDIELVGGKKVLWLTSKPGHFLLKMELQNIFYADLAKA